MVRLRGPVLPCGRALVLYQHAAELFSGPSLTTGRRVIRREHDDDDDDKNRSMKASPSSKPESATKNPGGLEDFDIDASARTTPLVDGGPPSSQHEDRAESWNVYAHAAKQGPEALSTGGRRQVLGVSRPELDQPRNYEAHQGLIEDDRAHEYVDVELDTHGHGTKRNYNVETLTHGTTANQRSTSGVRAKTDEQHSAAREESATLLVSRSDAGRQQDFPNATAGTSNNSTGHTELHQPERAARIGGVVMDLEDTRVKNADAAENNLKSTLPLAAVPTVPETTRRDEATSAAPINSTKKQSRFSSPHAASTSSTRNESHYFIAPLYHLDSKRRLQNASRARTSPAALEEEGSRIASPAHEESFLRDNIHDFQSPEEQTLRTKTTTNPSLAQPFRDATLRGSRTKQDEGLRAQEAKTGLGLGAEVEVEQRQDDHAAMVLRNPSEEDKDDTELRKRDGPHEEDMLDLDGVPAADTPPEEDARASTGNETQSENAVIGGAGPTVDEEVLEQGNGNDNDREPEASILEEDYPTIFNVWDEDEGYFYPEKDYALLELDDLQDSDEGHDDDRYTTSKSNWSRTINKTNTSSIGRDNKQDSFYHPQSRPWTSSRIVDTHRQDRGALVLGEHKDKAPSRTVAGAGAPGRPVSSPSSASLSSFSASHLGGEWGYSDPTCQKKSRSFPSGLAGGGLGRRRHGADEWHEYDDAGRSVNHLPTLLSIPEGEEATRPKKMKCKKQRKDLQTRKKIFRLHHISTIASHLAPQSSTTSSLATRR
ncbi:unnamed protein product [Amoebophrya sp. A120]|nr:unnamed protein product [Amoebophrya sp. A120]|eukprot:GSA120T00020330001.1